MPQLIPEGFDISPLPNEISSFLIQALQMIESSWTPNKKNPMKSRTGSGADGSPSAPKPASSLTLSSSSYSTKKQSSSCNPFFPCTEWLTKVKQEHFLASVRGPWFQKLCKMPQAIWLRRSGVTSSKVPFTLEAGPSCSRPSDVSLKPSTMPIHLLSARKQSLQSSFGTYLSSLQVAPRTSNSPLCTHCRPHAWKLLLCNAFVRVHEDSLAGLCQKDSDGLHHLLDCVRTSPKTL
jgi:hypothetical protein